jgi:hypothetical protein
MNDLMTRMDSALANDVDGRHSLFQLKHFILGKELTHQGRLWQCLKEIRSRRSSLEAVDLELDESNDQIELLNIQIEAEVEKADMTFTDETPFDRKYRLKASAIIERQLRRKETAANKNLASLQDQKRKLQEEAEFFVQSFEEMNSIEPVKSLDDADAQKEYWTTKLANDVHLKMLLGLPLDVELVRTVLSLNDDSPIKGQMIKMLEQARDTRLKIEG